MIISDVEYEGLLTLRLDDPSELRRRLSGRSKPLSILPGDGNLYLVAADHTARGVTAVGDYRLAMANRRDLLGRIMVALSVDGCDGVMASPDILEELAVLGALEDKVVIGTMNRGGLDGAVWAMDDRHTAFGPKDIEVAGLHGGKMLLRIHDGDPGTAATLELCSRYITSLADRGLMAMVEPLPYETNQHHQLALSNSPERLIRALSVASGLGVTSAYTWLKVPVIPELEAVMAATTLPGLMLGGGVVGEDDAAFARWHQFMKIPNMRGLVVGRNLLYPTDGDVLRASSISAEIVHG